MYQKFVTNDGGALILDFNFSPASVIPGIRGYLRIQDIPRYRVLPDSGNFFDWYKEFFLAYTQY